jgi:hypothetical protein
MNSELRVELEHWIDKWCLGQNSSTSKEVLADYILCCLITWNDTIEKCTMDNIEIHVDGVKNKVWRQDAN